MRDGAWTLPRRGRVCAALALLAGAAPCWAAGSADTTIAAPGQPAGPSRTLRLRAGVVDTRAIADLRAGAAEAAGRPAWGRASQDERLVVQFDGPMTREREAAIRRMGVELEQYLPDFAYLAHGSDAALSTLGRAAFVSWMGAVKPAWKIDPTLGRRAYATATRRAVRDAGLARALITLFPGADAAPVVRAVAAAGGRVYDVHAAGSRLLLDAELAPGAAARAGALAEVQWIEDAPEGEERSNDYGWVVQSNATNLTPVWNRGLHGENQIAGVIDGTVNAAHCAFYDAFFPIGPSHRKIVAQRDAQVSESHGTHVAGILAGDHDTLGAYDQGDGIAYAARLSLSDSGTLFSSPSGLYDRFAAAHADGARVHSNSFGDGSTGAYTSWCAQIDQFCYENEDDLVVFAVANQGTLKSPENALNALAVAASQDAPFQASYCFGTSGPTPDGRRKPDLMAPGCSIVSANSSTSCSYIAQSGTSMACPVAAGAGVLARQYFTDGFYPTGVATPANAFSPSSALLRAVLVNSTVDMTGIANFPSNVEGWGRVLLDNTLYFPGDLRKLLVYDVRNAAGLGTTETTTYTVTVLSASTPLNITMAFTHPPAAPNAADPVANDLDLEVVAPSGTLYRGNLYSAGQSFAGPTADPRNTVEQFLRTSPAPGTYQVTVRGTAVNVGTQGFALVISGDIDLCLPPVVPDPPRDLTAHPGDEVVLSAQAFGTGTLVYQWKKDLAEIPGATGPVYTIASAQLADAGEYSVTVTGTCGTVTTLGAQLRVECLSDFDHNSFVNGQDFDQFVTMFELGDESADVDRNGFVNGEDFDVFVIKFEEGC